MNLRGDITPAFSNTGTGPGEKSALQRLLEGIALNSASGVAQSTAEDAGDVASLAGLLIDPVRSGEQAGRSVRQALPAISEGVSNFASQPPSEMLSSAGALGSAALKAIQQGVEERGIGGVASAADFIPAGMLAGALPMLADVGKAAKVAQNPRGIARNVAIKLRDGKILEAETSITHPDLLGEFQLSDADIEGADMGFVGHDGNYLTRKEASAAVGRPFAESNRMRREGELTAAPQNPRAARLAELAEGVTDAGALERKRLDDVLGKFPDRDAERDALNREFTKVGSPIKDAAELQELKFKIREAERAEDKVRVPIERQRANLDNLPDVEKARLDRAVQQGFDLDAFHGTKGDIAEFDPGLLGVTTGAPSARVGFFFSAEPETAATYARSANLEDVRPELDEANLKLIQKIKDDTDAKRRPFSARWVEIKEEATASNVTDARLAELRKEMDEIDNQFVALKESQTKEIDSILNSGPGENIIPVKLRLQNPLVHDFGGGSYREVSYKELLDQARRDGKDGAIFRNTRDGGPVTDIYVVFEPAQIRSRFAAFDPDYVDPVDVPGANSLRGRIKGFEDNLEKLNRAIKNHPSPELIQVEIDGNKKIIEKLKGDLTAMGASAERPKIGNLIANAPPILFPLGAGAAAVSYSANQEAE